MAINEATAAKEAPEPDVQDDGERGRSTIDFPYLDLDVAVEIAKEEPRHPLIEGLLRELPKPQSEWSTEDRRKWLEMVSGIFNVIYKGSDSSRETVRVVIEKISAKP